jgi:hypothetical protein
MKLIASLFILAALAAAQTAVVPPLVGQKWEQPYGFVPGSSTAITNVDVWMQQIYLANTTAGSVTVSFVDQSTACSAGACTVWPAVTMAANSVYIAVMNVHVVGGLKWSASSGSAVTGYVSGAYTITLVAQVRPARHQNWFAAALRPRRKGTAAIPAIPEPAVIEVGGFSSFGGR